MQATLLTEKFLSALELKPCYQPCHGERLTGEDECELIASEHHRGQCSAWKGRDAHSSRDQEQPIRLSEHMKLHGYRASKNEDERCAERDP